MRQDLQAIQENFSLPGVLSFDQNEAGLIYARISTPSCTGELYLQGAHVTLWQPRSADSTDKPVLYMSPNSNFLPGHPIRGGVPIVFPWFADRSSASMGSRTDGPSHGFARLEDWTVAFAALAGPDLHMTLTLEPSEQARALGYDHFRLAYEITFGEVLRLRLTVANTGDEPFVFEEALHSYLAVGDATQISLTGLNDTEYLDKTDHFARKRQAESTLTLTGEIDRPYLNTVQTVWVLNPVFKRHINVFKAASHTTVIWNPWTELSAKLADLGPDEWRYFICVETANAAENTITLAPGTTHTMEARIGAEALPT